MPTIATIAPTDHDWYEALRAQGDLDEVNFWKPSAERAFRMEPFTPFLCKLKAPHNAICGFGFFARYARLPVWLAWECFGRGNGCFSRAEMANRIESIRRRMNYRPTQHPDDIGCIVLVQPTFFAPEDWIPQPRTWPARSLTPVTRTIAADAEWQRVWNECLARSGRRLNVVAEPEPRYGTSRLVTPRLGQGAFRVAVTDAYGRACAVTGEHSLPALEAAHIQPFAERGPHEVRNGLLLRADLHRLFDHGYLTIADGALRVSGKLRQDFANGRTYYPLDGCRVRLPQSPEDRPDPGLLRWHNEHVFVA